jgi:sugar-specific transcriptional regulator TrmB
MNIITTLKEYGFNEKDAKIYIYLLEHKDSLVYQIAKETKIPRTTVYASLEGLRHKNFASIFKKNNVAYWNAENPKRLVSAAEEKSKMINEILPNLESLFNKNDSNPNVKFYEGKESMKDVILNMYDYLHTRGIHEIYTISHPELFDNFPKLLPEFIKAREKLNIRTRLIAHHVAKTDTPVTYKTNSMRETRFLPEGFHFNCTMMIGGGGDMAAIISFKDNVPYSVTIESPTIVNMFRQVFLFAWQMAEREEKK